MAPPLRHTWVESERFVARTFVRPVQRFMDLEAAGGAVMMLGAVVALLWANSPWDGAYDTLFGTRLDISLGELAHLDLSLREWINDGLMTIFFFVVALEIKRELVLGELRDPRAAALPAIAAVGGMVVPALIYLAFNAGGAGSKGWGIPMATDIAFAAGVVSLLGRRVPSGAKLFLLTLAIVDDLGAIVVIAVFYTADLSLGWLGLAVLAVAGAVWLTRVYVRAAVPYALLGVFCWFALHESGVHATLAGVAFGFVCPAWSFYEPSRLGERAESIIRGIQRTHADDHIDQREHEENITRLADLKRLVHESESPLDRNEHKLAPWVSFGIVPLFALANAGVDIGGAGFGSVAVGVAVGLVVGKSIGVFGATWLAVRAGIGRLPLATTWSHLFGIAMTAGIGFTVALFVASLSFDDAVVTDEAKVGILVGSLVAGVAGYSWLRRTATPDPVEAPDVRADGVPEGRVRPPGETAPLA